jgi:two-component system, OmpR family, alkaline phosphatase synthesis response regulator PhoP
MADAHILVVDDELELQELVRYNLLKAGYRVTCVGCGEEALTQVHTQPTDLLILDLLLPGIDGLDVCKTLKRDPHTIAIPIIMLTARSEEADIVTGLELGADDYLTKPFSPRVLLARVKAALRRATGMSEAETMVIAYENVRIHPGHRDVRVGTRPIQLTPTEFNILHMLAQRPGWVFTRYQIVDRARGNDAGVTERSVDVHITALRRKLGDAGAAIETIRGIGYRLRTPEVPV